LADKLDAVDDITALIEFWDKQRKQGTAIELGQIVFTPVPNTERKPTVADAVRADPHSHRQADLAIRPLDEKTDFRGKPARLPIKALHLAQTEEILISRAKKRPCLVLAKTEGVDSKSLPVGRQRDQALNAFQGAYCVAPIYSVSTAEAPTSFGPVMTARIKCMMYPEFIYVPPSGLIIKDPGVIRLDRLFWSHLASATTAENLFVTDSIIGICSNQIQILRGLPPSKDYLDMRALMMMSLPENCKTPGGT